MNAILTLQAALLLVPVVVWAGTDIELAETNLLPQCHSIGWVSAWVKADPQARGKGWDGVLDEAKWGTPAPQQLVTRQWDWKFTDAQWAEAVRQKGEGKREEVRFALWLPGDCPQVKGIVVMSGHGSGEALFRRADMRALARELHLALFKFVGNPMQRGFWPRSLLPERLKAFGQKAGHPELEHAPLFLYGHSNGTGFSAIFPATEGARVWAWVSMRPGITFQVYQPGAGPRPCHLRRGRSLPRPPLEGRKPRRRARAAEAVWSALELRRRAEDRSRPRRKNLATGVFVPTPHLFRARAHRG
jgi:hypothetical protein